jgi:hypothetical protein
MDKNMAKVDPRDQYKLVTPPRTLAAAEELIANAAKAFLNAGVALKAIRDKKLYVWPHETFEAYVEARWDISRAQAYRLIEAAEIVKALSPFGDTPLPTARPPQHA